MSRWPDFFIVGAVKAGTTAVYDGLRHHPRIFMDDQLSGEARPNCLTSTAAIEGIAGKCPKARIVIMLREPVSRAFSQYLMARDRYRVKLPEFSKAIAEDLDARVHGKIGHNLVARGEYGRWVPKWINRFGERQTGIFLFDELVREPQAFLGKVAEFLGLDPADFPERIPVTDRNPYARPRARFISALSRIASLKRVWRKAANVGLDTARLRNLLYRETPKPGIDLEAATVLADYYRDDIAQLELALNQPLPELHYHGSTNT